jgi:hypothetical protein
MWALQAPNPLIVIAHRRADRVSAAPIVVFAVLVGAWAAVHRQPGLLGGYHRDFALVCSSALICMAIGIRSASPLRTARGSTRRSGPSST